MPYGWSASLNLRFPAAARFVRFQWDGNNDALHEVDIGFTSNYNPTPTNALTVVADAQTVAGLPGTNYGSLGTLSVTAAAGAESVRSYLRFDLSAIPSGAMIQSAQLQLHPADVSGTGTRQVQVFGVNSPWTETGIRWNGQPAVSAPGAIASIAINQWTTWDITALARAWAGGTNNGLAVRPVTIAGQSFGVVFRSREATTNRPRVLVTYLPLAPATASYVQLRQESATTAVGYFRGGLPTTVQAQWPIPTNAPADTLERAWNYLERYRDLYLLENPRAQFTPRRRSTSRWGRHTVFEQVHEGVPVLGSQLIVYNPDQKDLDHNGIGYACDPNERLVYPPFDLRRIQREIKFLSNARVLEIPLDFCTTPGCGDPLPEDFLTEMRLGLPSGIRARIIDDEARTVAKDSGKAQLLRFPPRTDWSYRMPPDGGGTAGGLAPASVLPELYHGASYALVLTRDATVPTDVALPVTIELGTYAANAARLQIRIENQRPIVTINGSPNRDYRLEFSPDLRTWSTVATLNSDTGQIVYTGTPGLSVRRFYRAIALP